MPPRFEPTRLVDYPWVVVRVDCVLCRRVGRYRLARLAARYGPEQSLDGLMADLARDCPWWRVNPRKYEPRCGIRFVDLESALPPPDHPDEPIFRQRQPGREDVPKPPRAANRFPAVQQGEGPRLSDWAGNAVSYRCRRCDRRGTFGKAGLLARFGDKRLTELLGDLAAGCPRLGNTQVYELCGVVFVIPTGQR